MLLTFSRGEELISSGNLPDALDALMEEAKEDPENPWLLYRLSWVCNRMELPEAAVGPALTAWNMDPANQWYLSEHLRALKNMGRFSEILEYSAYVRGGGVCRYYMAVAEEECTTGPFPSVEYFLETACSDNDSVASDACIWLCIILRDEVPTDSLLALSVSAVERSPGTGFYRCVLVEHLSEAGRLDEAGEQLRFIRLSGETDYYYWQSFSRLAEAEGDAGRRIWALRRARQSRNCPESSRNLGWALYLSGRDALRNGDLRYSMERLTEAVLLGDSTELFVLKSDSLQGLIHEFEDCTSGSG